MKAQIELHVHPFLGKNKLTDVIEAMDKTGLNVLALESLDSTLYYRILQDVARHYPSSTHDNAGVRLSDGKFLLNAREYNTRENLHVLTVGYSVDEATPQTEIRKVIDAGLSHGALVLLDHPFVDNGETKTAGHISERLTQELEKICKEYSGQITLEWNGYCHSGWRRFIRSASKAFLKNHIARGISSYMSKHLSETTVGAFFQLANALGNNPFEYYDVNQKVEELSYTLKGQGFNVPVVADTDLHGREKASLHSMGTSRMIMRMLGRM